MTTKLRIRDLRPEGDPFDVPRINAAGDGFELAPPSEPGPSNLADLADVDLTGISVGDIIQWNGTHFVPIDTPSGGGGGVTDLDGLSDVDLTGQVDGNYLKRVSGVWVPAAGPGGGGGPTYVRSSLDGTSLPVVSSWTAVDTSKDLALTGLTAGDVVRCHLCNLDIASASTAVIYSDDFNRSAGSNSFGSPQIGGAYSYPAGSSTLDGANAVAAAASGDNVWVTELGRTTYDFFATINQLGSSPAIVVRVQDASNWVLITLTGTQSIYNQASGSYDGGTALTTQPTWVATDVVKVSVTPADIKVYRQAAGAGAFTLLGTKTNSALPTATKAGIRQNGTGTAFKVSEAHAEAVANILDVDQLLFDLVTRPSSSNVNSVFTGTTAPSGSTGPGAVSIPSVRWTPGAMEVDYTVQSGDLSSGATALRLMYRTPGNTSRTLTRARLMAAKL